MGSSINSSKNESSPRVTSDGAYMFFTRMSESDWDGDFYWVSVEELIDSLRNINNDIPTTTNIDLKPDNILVFPNPARQSIQIRADNFLLNRAQYRLSDQNGKIVIHGKLNAEIIDISELAKGNYILILNSDKATTTKKIVIE